MEFGSLIFLSESFGSIFISISLLGKLIDWLLFSIFNLLDFLANGVCLLVNLTNDLDLVITKGFVFSID